MDTTLMVLTEPDLNITMIWVIIVGFLMIYKGYHRGMAKEISGLIALVAGFLVLAMIIMLSASFRKGEMVHVIYTVILLCIFGLVYGVIKGILGVIKLCASLPILSFFNRLLGAVVGVGKTVFIAWIFFLLYAKGYLGDLTQTIQADIAKSAFLQTLYESNFFL